MAMHDVAVRLREKGPMAELDLMERFNNHDVGSLHSFAGFDGVRRLESEYLPEQELAKYADSIGHMPGD